MRTATDILADLWLDVTLYGSRLGAVILWNAMYHLNPQSGMIPSFDREWARTKEPRI